MLKQVQHDSKVGFSSFCHPEPGPEPDSGSIDFGISVLDLEFGFCPLWAGLFTPLEIMPRCSAAGLDFRIIPAGFYAPLEFLTGFT